jgi:hypothetical protein
MIMSDRLNELAMTPVFLLAEFFESILPLAEAAREFAGEDRHDFYVLRLLPVLISHSREIGMPIPHETALFVVRLIDEALVQAG